MNLGPNCLLITSVLIFGGALRAYTVENVLPAESLTANRGLALSDFTLEDQESIGVQHFEHGEYKYALEALQSPAMMGRAKAQYFLGRIYREGHVVSKDPREAVKWFSKAVRRGYLPAFGPLARMYFDGEGVGGTAR